MQGPHFSRWQTGPPDGNGWRWCELPNFREAEELLDLLERCGIEEREVILTDGRLAIRWREPVARNEGPQTRVCG